VCSIVMIALVERGLVVVAVWLRMLPFLLVPFL
jgi:hypothetical protein